MIDTPELIMVWQAILCLVMFGLGWFSCLVFMLFFRAIKMEKYDNAKIQKVITRSGDTNKKKSR